MKYTIRAALFLFMVLYTVIIGFSKFTFEIRTLLVFGLAVVCQLTALHYCLTKMEQQAEMYHD